MNIDKSKVKAIFEFTPDKYFLVRDLSRDNPYEYSLNHRIDRRYKGKDDDVGLAKIFLDEAEADWCRKEGFTLIEL